MSTCLGGAFLGSMFSGLIADGLGRRRSFQLCALPMILGSSIRLTFCGKMFQLNSICVLKLHVISL